MRWQRSMFQTKEQNKTPEQLSDMEIGNLPEKEFRGSDCKNNQRTWEKNTITEMKNTLEGINTE